MITVSILYLFDARLVPIQLRAMRTNPDYQYLSATIWDYLEFRGLSVIGVQMSLQVKCRQIIGQLKFTLGTNLTPFTLLINFMFECPIYD